MSPTPDPLRDAAPAYDDPEAKRARAGVAAALFGGPPPAPVRVGRYELVGRLGAGGMGVVHRAHDPELDRPVAVKLLRPEVSDDGKARARMLREARSLAKLSHPNVITVYDVGTVDDGQVFVAMELVAGKDLRRWLADRRTSAEGDAWMEVLERFLAAGRGLEAAHEAGLTHRDFKPENVLVGDDGRVRVLDFGLARASATSLEQPSSGEPRAGQVATGDLDGLTGDLARMPTVEHRSGSSLDGSLTETGAVLGTPLYMAPELYSGHPADAASDQFAYCASLWEGIYGRRPFGAQDLIRHVEAVKAGVLVEPPVDSPVPIELHRIVRRGLEPDPRQRYPSMHALLHELEQLVRQASSGSVVAARSGGGASWRWLMLVAVMLAGAMGLLGWKLELFDGSPEPREPEVEPEPSEPREPEPTVEPSTTTTTTTGLAVEPANDTRETGESTDTDDTTAASDTSETSVPTHPIEPTAQDWCHLHEDSYTLLARTARRRANFEDAGTCYVCRVESRRSRTRNFSPRDCAGYSLCGSAAAEACR